MLQLWILILTSALHNDYECSCPTNEDSHRAQVICPRSHSWCGLESGLKTLSISHCSFCINAQGMVVFNQFNMQEAGSWGMFSGVITSGRGHFPGWPIDATWERVESICRKSVISAVEMERRGTILRAVLCSMGDRECAVREEWPIEENACDKIRAQRGRSGVPSPFCWCQSVLISGDET